MKKLMFLCYLICVFNDVQAQSDTSKKAPSIKSAAGKDATYIMDGIISDEKLNGLNPNDILSVDILKRDPNSTLEGIAEHNTVIIVTKDFAIKHYQKKISMLSNEYKAYLNKHHQDDKRLPFVINGEQYPTSTNDRIKKLYKLFADNARYQSFSLHYVEGYDSTPSYVEIKTQ